MWVWVCVCVMSEVMRRADLTFRLQTSHLVELCGENQTDEEWGMKDSVKLFLFSLWRQQKLRAGTVTGLSVYDSTFRAWPLWLITETKRDQLLSFRLQPEDQPPSGSHNTSETEQEDLLSLTDPRVPTPHSSCKKNFNHTNTLPGSLQVFTSQI